MRQQSVAAPAPQSGGRLGDATGVLDHFLGDFARDTWRDELARLDALDGPMDWRVLIERFAALDTAEHGDDAPSDPTADHHRAQPSPASGSPELLAALGLPAPLIRALDDTDAASLEAVDATWSMVEDVQRAINALEGLRVVLVERGRRQAERCQDALVDDTDPVARTSSRARGSELAERATIADLAGVLHVGETAAGTLMDHSRTLTSKAPGTLAALARGEVSLRHATAIAKHVDDLDADAARRVETAVLPGAGSVTPRRLEDRVRAAREETHPTPLDVRHADARVNSGRPRQGRYGVPDGIPARRARLRGARSPDHHGADRAG
jgi:hypothetical protein